MPFVFTRIYPRSRRKNIRIYTLFLNRCNVLQCLGVVFHKNISGSSTPTSSRYDKLLCGKGMWVNESVNCSLLLCLRRSDECVFCIKSIINQAADIDGFAILSKTAPFLLFIVLLILRPQCISQEKCLHTTVIRYILDKIKPLRWSCLLPETQAPPRTWKRLTVEAALENLSVFSWPLLPQLNDAILDAFSSSLPNLPSSHSVLLTI